MKNTIHMMGLSILAALLVFSTLASGDAIATRDNGATVFKGEGDEWDL